MNKGNERAATILVVDDDPSQRNLLETFLSAQGFNVITASCGTEGLAAIESTVPSVVLSDVRMPGMSGLEMFRRIRQSHPHMPVLLLTAFPEIRDAVQAMQDGAVNYLEKPIDLDEMLESVRRFTRGASEPTRQPEGEVTLPEGIVAQSPQIREVFRQAAIVAPSEARALITGESGVGKEVIADLLHRWSRRATGPLVKVNCAAIPENLLESELFGHKKGSFTGATADRIGRFEQANGGTILLDEVAEMSPGLQAKLLRVTQDGSFQKIGSNVDIKADARILASTNRNLDKEVEEGRFREDLFFRLNVIEIYVPPLRERTQDIIPLAQFFAGEFAGHRKRFSPATTRCLERYEWPGNIRELRNAMERASLMSRGDLILPEHLPKRVQRATGELSVNVTASGTTRMEEIEREAILSALRSHDFNRSETARALGISRRTLLYKLKRFEEQGFTTTPT